MSKYYDPGFNAKLDDEYKPNTPQPNDLHTIKFYTWKEIEAILTKWSKEQEEFANDYWMPEKAEQKGYKKAMKRLRYMLKNPVEYIL